MGSTTAEDKPVENENKPKATTSNKDVAMESPSKTSEENGSQVSLQTETLPTSSETENPRPATASGWLGGWLSQPALQVSSVPGASAPIAGSNPPDKSRVSEQQEVQNDVSPTDGPPQELPQANTAPSAAASWFGLWSTATPSTVTEAPKEQIPVKLKDEDEDTVMEDAPAPVQPPAGSSWAFWSTEAPKKAAETSSASENKGELAVAGESSQNKPESAKAATTKENKKTNTTKRGRPISVDLGGPIAKATHLDTSSKNTPSQSPAPAKTSPPNLLIPSVRSTYRLVENPTILQQIARLLLHGKQEPVKHVFLVKDPPKIKNALAIGIHGLFPAPLLRTIIGQPTGTSIKFANHAAAAIRRWADKNNNSCEIEKVALEGEGKIAERVDNLWKLLLNWIDHIRKADFILIACHSQGVPVALMLVAKLVEFGVVSTGRIGICAMGKSCPSCGLLRLSSLLAGVSLGPFPDYKSKLFSGSAGELFEFANSESSVSKRYEDALRVAVKYGVRITYCGSIDDQLVSMEVCELQPLVEQKTDHLLVIHLLPS